jgi:hypothetical protein
MEEPPGVSLLLKITLNHWLSGLQNGSMVRHLQWFVMMAPSGPASKHTLVPFLVSSAETCILEFDISCHFELGLLQSVPSFASSPTDFAWMHCPVLNTTSSYAEV